MRRAMISLVLGLVAAGAGLLLWQRCGHRVGPNRAVQAGERHAARLERELAEQGLALGAPLFLRVTKEPAELEAWLAPAPGGDGAYRRLRTYPICAYSGELGPKTAEGDGQAPEGLYEVRREQLNPWSRFHLSFDLGYPNEVERARGWTGSALMIHGRCVSIGCYAMGDAAIEELYLLVESALDAGLGAVPVHVFPFPLTDAALAEHEGAKEHAYWRDLQPAYAAFERSHRPPVVAGRGSHYEIRSL